MVIGAPLRCLGPSQGSLPARRAPIEEPCWAGNLSPCHAAVLSTPLIQSLPCHGGTGRALIQFTQQQKKKKPQTHSSLPAEYCQNLHVTLSEKDEGNYRGAIILFLLHVQFFSFFSSPLSLPPSQMSRANCRRLVPKTQGDGI